jgi:hypothetical protein
VGAGQRPAHRIPDSFLNFHKNRRNRWLLAAFHQTYRGSFRPYRLTRLEPLEDGLACLIIRHPPGPLHGFYATPSGGSKDFDTWSRCDWIELDDEGGSENVGYYFKKGRYRSMHLYEG